MADETDVEDTLVSLISGFLYPNGTSNPSAASPVPPKGIQVFRGWPSAQSQTAAATADAQFVNVSVASRNGVERNTSRYGYIWQPLTMPNNTITISTTGQTITLGGTVSTPQNIFVLIGEFNVFNYAVQEADTLSTIATALASLINAKYSGTTSNGPIVTVNSSQEISVRVAGVGTAIMEVARQEKSFQITIWAPPCSTSGLDADAWRTAVAKVIDPALKRLVRIVLPDQTYAHIHYERTITMDLAQNEQLYRRDLFFWVEYATTITENAYQIGAFQTKVQATPLDLPLSQEGFTSPSDEENLPSLPSDTVTVTTNS